MRTAKLAAAVTRAAQAGSDPVVVRFNKLEEFAKRFGYTLQVFGDEFYVRVPSGEIVAVCDTTEEIDEFFLTTHGKGAL